MLERIYGIHAVTALLTFKPDCVKGIVVQSARDDAALQLCLDLAEQANIPVDKRSRKDIDEMFKEKVVHQGIVATCSHMPIYGEGDLEGIVSAAAKPSLLLFLDGIQDPHNLGACMRVANGFGACAVVAPKNNSVGLTAAAIKVSTGAAFATPFVQVTNLARTMRKVQEMGVWLVGGSAHADTELKDIDMQGDIGIVMGAEGLGLRSLTAKTCDFLAKIPLLGTVDSLNVSVATGVMLYEVYRQREE